MDMAATATSEVERFDWLFLALAWQALARCQDDHDDQDEASSQDTRPQVL